MVVVGVAVWLMVFVVVVGAVVAASVAIVVVLAGVVVVAVVVVAVAVGVLIVVCFIVLIVVVESVWSVQLSQIEQRSSSHDSGAHWICWAIGFWTLVVFPALATYRNLKATSKNALGTFL